MVPSEIPQVRERSYKWTGGEEKKKNPHPPTENAKGDSVRTCGGVKRGSVLAY